MSKHTLQGTNLKRLRKSGFRARMRTVGGKRILNLRRSKKRKRISL